jgi:four helix bundle protein
VSQSIKSFRDLRVWSASVDLVEHIYVVTRTLPREETYGLIGQMRRAAVSVASNIAEGHARQHRKEFLHHLSFAQASLAELETQLEIALRLKYISPQRYEEVLSMIVSVGKQLHALRNALSRPQPPTPNP